MSLPTGVTAHPTEQNVFVGPTGHRLVNCTSVAQLRQLGAAMFFFSSGAYRVLVGADLDAFTGNVADNQILAQLALGAHSRRSYSASGVVNGGKYKVQRMVSRMAHYTSSDQLTAIFGIELSPFVHSGYHCGGETRMLNDANGPGRIEQNYGISIGGITNGYMNPGFSISTTDYPPSTTSPGDDDCRYVLRLPLGCTWETYFKNVCDSYPDSDQPDVKTKLDAAVALLMPAAKAVSSTPTVFAEFTFSKAEQTFKYIKPTSPSETTAWAVYADAAGAWNTQTWVTGAGAPALAENASLVTALPDLAGLTTLSVTEIDGVSLAALTRGLHFYDTHDVASDALAAPAATITMSQIISDLNAATITPSSSGIPARPLDGNNLPVDDTQYAAFLSNTVATQGASSFAGVVLPPIMSHGLTALHFGLLVGCAMQPNLYDMAMLAPADPVQFGIMPYIVSGQGSMIPGSFFFTGSDNSSLVVQAPPPVSFSDYLRYVQATGNCYNPAALPTS